VRDRASILVVDDDPVNRAMLTAALERDGHRVVTAEDGRPALDLVRSEEKVVSAALGPHQSKSFLDRVTQILGR